MVLLKTSYHKSNLMKKISFLFVAFCLTGTLMAQVSLRPQIGFNSSTLTKDFQNASFGDQLGFQFGLDAQLGRRFYVQPGIMWESLNNELQESINGDNDEFSVNRVRIPIMFGYKVLGPETDGLIDLRLFTGPNASFAISKDLNESSLISKDDFKGAVYGWNVGVGFDLAIVFVDAGYSFGLSEVFEGMASDVRNNLWYVNAGLRIGF